MRASLCYGEWRYGNNRDATVKKPIGLKKPINTGGIAARKPTTKVSYAEYVLWVLSFILTNSCFKSQMTMNAIKKNFTGNSNAE